MRWAAAPQEELVRVTFLVTMSMRSRSVQPKFLHTM